MKTFKMASGSQALVLADVVNWDEYPDLATQWITRLGAIVISRADSVDERITEIEIEGHRYWLSYDDNISALHLEPKDEHANQFLLRKKTYIEMRSQGDR